VWLFLLDPGDCKGLTGLTKGLSALTALQMLGLQECKWLTALPEGLSALTALKTLTRREEKKMISNPSFNAQDQAPDDSQAPDDTHVQERQCAACNFVRKSSQKQPRACREKKKKRRKKTKHPLTLFTLGFRLFFIQLQINFNHKSVLALS
jgi:hypothetical protein